MIVRLIFAILILASMPLQAQDNRLYYMVLNSSTIFLGKHLRWPEGEEIDRILEDAKEALVRKAPKDQREALFDELASLKIEDVLPKNPDNIMKDYRANYTARYMQLRRKIATAYNRAIRQSDLEPRFRTLVRTPSRELFFYAMVKAKSFGGPTVLGDYIQGSMDLDKFSELFTPGAKHDGPFPQPLIFERGMQELIEATRFDFPATFRNYLDTDIINDARAADTLKAIEKAKGFVAVSWTSGKPLNRDYLEALLKMVEERDWILLVGPTQQNFEGMPEEFFTNPRIKLLVQTIENRYLKISNIALNPNVENPLVRLKKANATRPGQTVIVFHPHQMMEPVASTTNTYMPVQLWSTGSLNEPLGSFTGISSAGTAESNKLFHKMKFLAVEKGDGVSRFDSDVLQNVWHVRPVTFFNDVEYDGTAGFIDMGKTYQFRYDGHGGRNFEEFKQDPKYIYIGDLHDRVTDPRFVKSLIEDSGLTAESEVTFVTGDTFDGGSINHWLDDKIVALNAKAQSGGLRAINEVNELIDSVNGLLQRFPKARFNFIVGNHDEWLTRLLEKTPNLHDVVNGDFLDELGFAVKSMNFNVWDYIFHHRQTIMGAMLEKYPEKRRQILSRVKKIEDSDRIDVLTRGDDLFAGPPWRKNAIQFHGDRGSGGRGTTNKGHAQAMPEGGGIVGHSHRLGIYSEVMNVGMGAEVEQEYTIGGYGAQGQGFAYLYGNGTKQLYTYSRMAGTFRQRFPSRVPSVDKFFGEDRLKLVPNDNDLVDKVEGEGKIMAELQRLRLANTDGCEELFKGQ